MPDKYEVADLTPGKVHTWACNRALEAARLVDLLLADGVEPARVRVLRVSTTRRQENVTMGMLPPEVAAALVERLR